MTKNMEEKIDNLTNNLDNLAIIMAKGFERVEGRLDRVETRLDKVETGLNDLSLGQEAIRNVLMGNQDRRMDVIENDNKAIKIVIKKHLRVQI